MKAVYLLIAAMGAISLCLLATLAAASWALGNFEAVQELVVGGAFISVVAPAILCMAAWAGDAYLQLSRESRKPSPRSLHGVWARKRGRIVRVG